MAAGATACASVESTLPSLLAKLVDKDSSCKRASMEAIKELIDRELTEDSMPFFIETLLGTMDKRSRHYVPSVESPSSLAHSLCFLLAELVCKAAHTHAVKLRPCYISSVMRSVISWFPLDSGSQSHSLHQACAKLVCSLAGNAVINGENSEFSDASCMMINASTSECNDSACPSNASTSSIDCQTQEFSATSSSLHEAVPPYCALVVDCLCRPLLGALCSRVEPVAMGATTCLDALVSMEACWSFAPSYLVEELCSKASNAMQERTALSANTAQLSLLCNLAKTNPESLSSFRAGLLQKGADILLSNGAWQKRAAAARLMESLFSRGASGVMESKHEKQAMVHAIEALEKCKPDKVAMVRSAVGEALKKAKQQSTPDTHHFPLTDNLHTGPTKASRPSFCMQGSTSDYRKRRRKKALGLHEKQPASSFPRRNDPLFNCTSSSSTWSSIDSVNSSVDFECPKRKVPRVSCNGRASSSTDYGLICPKTAKKPGATTVTPLPLSTSASSSPSSSLLSSPSVSSSSSSSSSSVPPIGNDPCFVSRPTLNRSSCNSPSADTGCPSAKVAGIGRNTKPGSSPCQCTDSKAKENMQVLISPTSSSASFSSKPTLVDVRASDDEGFDTLCLTTQSYHKSPPYSVSVEETMQHALYITQKEGTLVMEPLRFTEMDSHRMQESNPCCIREGEFGNVSNKDAYEEVEENECCSSTTPTSIHYNSIAQLESLEEVMSPQVCESGKKQDDLFIYSTPRTIFPICDTCNTLPKGNTPWLSTDAIDGMPLEMKNEICSDSVWKVRDNPIATDDSEFDLPRLTLFDGTVIYRIDGIDDEDDLVPKHHDDDDEFDISTWCQNDGIAIRNGLRHVGARHDSFSREHQARKSNDDVVSLEDDGAGDNDGNSGDAYGSGMPSLGKYNRDDETGDNSSDMLADIMKHRKQHNGSCSVSEEHTPEPTHNTVYVSHPANESHAGHIAAKNNNSSDQHDGALLKVDTTNNLVKTGWRTMESGVSQEHPNVCRASMLGVCHAAGADDVDPAVRESHDNSCALTISALEEGVNDPLPDEEHPANEAGLLDIQGDNDVNQTFISRELRQLSNGAGLRLCNDGYGGADNNFGGLLLLMEPHQRLCHQFACHHQGAGFERLHSNGCAIVRNQGERKNLTHSERKQALKPTMAMEDLQACSVAKSSCDEEGHGGGHVEGSDNSLVASWFRRSYVIRKLGVLFTPSGAFFLTLALPIAIVAFNTIYTKEGTSHLLVPT